MREATRKFLILSLGYLAVLIGMYALPFSTIPNADVMFMVGYAIGSWVYVLIGYGTAFYVSQRIKRGWGRKTAYLIGGLIPLFFTGVVASFRVDATLMYLGVESFPIVITACVAYGVFAVVMGWRYWLSELSVEG